MPDIGQLVLFFAAALLLAVTPGPGIFYVAARTLAGGRSERIASCLGTGLGSTVHVLAVMLPSERSSAEAAVLNFANLREPASGFCLIRQN